MVTKEDIGKAEEALAKLSTVVNDAMGVCLADNRDYKALCFLKDLVRRIDEEM